MDSVHKNLEFFYNNRILKLEMNSIDHLDIAALN